MWSLKFVKVSLNFVRRTFSVNTPVAAGFDLLSLEKDNSPAREEFYYDFLYGIHPVSCAIEAKRRSIETVFYRRDLVDHSVRVKKILERCWVENIKTQPTVQSKIDLMVGKGKPHQGIVAKSSRLNHKHISCTHQYISGLVEEQSSKQLWLLLHDIQDPMNLGSILRTAYFLGCDKIFVSSQNSCSLTPVVSKASSGAMEMIHVHAVNNIPEFCKVLKDLKWRVVGTGSKSMNGHLSEIPCTPVDSFHFKDSTLIILGNEGRGLTNDVTNLCQEHIYIDSKKTVSETVDSINVSNAAAIIMHSILNSCNRK